MIAANYTTVRDNLKNYCDRAYREKETVIVTRKNEENVVIISLDEWNALQKMRRNAEYLMKLERSLAQLNRGEEIVKTLDELEALEDE
jgi:antitoxin YefM